jgi:hypothetical protein
MRHFFITGLPRSRTAWLANLLTTDRTFCWHEDRHGRLHDVRRYDVLGNCGPHILSNWLNCVTQYPDAQWVVIHRDPDAVEQAHKKALPELGNPDIAALSTRMELLLKHIGESSPRLLQVGYSLLDEADTCASIFRHCTGLEPDMERIKLLQTLNVQVHATKAAQSLPAPLKAAAARAYKQPVTPKSVEYQAMLQELCAGCPEAYEWLLAVLDLAMTWDHLVDGDCIDNEVAERAFKALLFRWPYNAFWLRNASILAPVLSNAITAWRSGGRVKEYDLYSELPCTVAYLLGGHALAEHWSPRIRKLTAELMAEDNQLDNQ